MQERTLDAILAMLTGLGIPHGTDPDVLLRTYAIAVHGIREDCIVEVCGKYIRGEVEGHKKGRAPTTDLFTTECRSEASARTAHENRKTKRIEAPKETEHSEEHRVKMAALLSMLGRAHNGDREAQAFIDSWMADRGAVNHGWGRRKLA
jgi:hypothetical protein